MSIYRGKTAREVYMANLLYDAIDDEDTNSIINFLARGADCNIVLPSKGISPFHLVIGKDNEEFAKKLTVTLLQYRADPNVRTDDGLTPLHIAAAYGRREILHALLCCGGNPDLRDANRMKPIDYAHEHGWKECVDLISSFMEKPKLFDKKELSPAFNLTLEKIVVENGGNTGEYEIVQEYETEQTAEKHVETEQLTEKLVEFLADLPETCTTEYVMEWFQTQIKPEILEKPSITSCDTNDSDRCESSYDESDGGKSVHYKLKGDAMKFRKKYHKCRKTHRNNGNNSTESVQCSSTPINKPRIDHESVPKILNEVTNSTMFTTLKEFSKESGIMTLPNSRNESDKENEISSNNANDVTVSSDYRTCTEANSNEHEITDDLSHLVVDDRKIRKISSKSQDVSNNSNEISFVSVSEVYKYIDDDEGVVLYEKRLLKTGTSDYAGSIVSSSISSKLSSVPVSVDYDTDTLRKELTSHGYNPGPITLTTKRVYLRKLKQIRKHPLEFQTDNVNRKIFSVELEKTLRDPNWMKDPSIYKTIEESLITEFSNPNPSRKWREGVNKTSFTYLLLDPRITNNLPCRAEFMDPKEVWEVFLSSIFYVGKGKRSRPYSHLYESVGLWKQGKKHTSSKKINHILNIWNDEYGVICLHVFQNVIPVEAYTREAAMISALKIENLKNIKRGEFYGVISTLTQKQKKMLGVYLLYKAMLIFINEGERQLSPRDIE